MPNPVKIRSWKFCGEPDAWYDLTFIPGESLALESVLTNPLPGGNVTAFGLYMDGPSASTMRFDTFEVWVVPEPASLLLVLSGAIGVLAWPRRR